MVNYNINRYIAAITIIVIVIFAVCFCVWQRPLWNSISYSISATSIIAVIFIKYAWKWNIFKKWFVPFSNLNGKWEGVIQSSYETTSNDIPIRLDIKQTFLHIQIKCSTNESKSNSLVAAFNIDQDRNIRQLCYSYQNDPKATIREKSPIHYGSVILEINEQDDQMDGQYWTSRKTIGVMHVEKIK